MSCSLLHAPDVPQRRDWLAQISGSGPLINSRKRAPIVFGAGRGCACAVAVVGAAAATNAAAVPAAWTNSRLLVSLLMIAPGTLWQTLWLMPTQLLLRRKLSERCFCLAAPDDVMLL